MYKYYKYALITLICCLSAASFASDNIQKTTNNFNFKNLSAPKNYAALDYGVYDPDKAIEVCRTSPNLLPAGGIWPADPSNPFPSPEPDPDGADCEIRSQIAYGCTNYASSTGRALTKSVVGIMMLHPNKKNVWIQICTGTVVDNQWVLTAAHCVVKDTSSSLINARSLIVVPWQWIEHTGNFGVPLILEGDALGAYDTIKVRAVNIPQAYTNVFINAYSPDLALLKIEPIKPYMGLEPVSLANQSFLSKTRTPVIKAGYGKKEDQQQDGQLRYRKSYYITNIYNKNPKEEVSGNYGDIYTLDSKPINYKGIKSAWSFTGTGDSGGPVLSYNSLTRKFQVEGVNSAALFCDYAGYFAQLPYPYSKEASTTYPKNYDFIKSVMNGAPDPSQVRCNGECYFKTLYVINQTDNSINRYKFDHNNNLLLPSKTPTGVYPTKIAFSPDNSTAFVTNFISNSIVQYNVGYSSLGYEYTFNLAEGYKGPVDIAFLSDKDMFVIAKNSHLLLQYSSAFIRGWYMYEAWQTLTNPTHLNVISIYNRTFLLVSNEKEIDVYEWYKSERKLLDTTYKIKLNSDTEQLIEIKPFGYPNNQKLYALTTRGVYIYQPNISNEDITFSVIGHLTSHFASDNHLVPLYENSFAISDKYSNSVLIYEVAKDNTIKFKKDITMQEPGEMAFDDGVLYVSSQPRSLYSYIISPDLTVSAKHQIVQTGEGPTKIEINNRNYSE